MTDDGLDRLFSDLQTILTPEEVAGLLRMNKAAIYRWLNEGYLPGHKLGNNWRILREDLHEWMRQGSNSSQRDLLRAGKDGPEPDVGDRDPDPETADP